MEKENKELIKLINLLKEKKSVSEQFDEIIGKLPFEERMVVRDNLYEVKNNEYWRGYIVAGSSVLLVLGGFIAGLFVFL